jgi:hypothetical protein
MNEIERHGKSVPLGGAFSFPDLEGEEYRKSAEKEDAEVPLPHIFCERKRSKKRRENRRETVLLKMELEISVCRFFCI